LPKACAAALCCHMLCCAVLCCADAVLHFGVS